MKLFSRATTLTLPLLAAMIWTSGVGCDGLLPDDDDSAGDDDDSAGTDTEFDSVDNDADGLTDCDDPDCAADAECDGPTWVWVAVRSRTATQADIDSNTPGPDIDAVELFDGVNTVSLDANSVTFVQGGVGAAGNANDNAVRVAGAPDAGIGGTCDLAEEPNGKFWSMGGGAIDLGIEGFFIGQFAATAEIVAGDRITVYEVGAAGCDNVDTVRDDDYEIYIGTSDVDDTAVNIDSFDGVNWVSLGRTGTNGNVKEVTVP